MTLTRRLYLPLGALAIATFVAREAPALVPADMKALKVKAPQGWEGEYNANLSSWTYEKYIKVGERRKPNRLYIDKLPDGVPTKGKEYAEKLKTKNWQDIGYVYIEITEVTDLEGGGFLIKGIVKDHSDKEAKPEPGFVMVKKVGDLTLRAKSGTLVNEDMRKEGIEVLKNASF